MPIMPNSLCLENEGSKNQTFLATELAEAFPLRAVLCHLSSIYLLPLSELTSGQWQRLSSSALCKKNCMVAHMRWFGTV